MLALASVNASTKWLVNACATTGSGIGMVGMDISLALGERSPLAVGGGVLSLGVGGVVLWAINA